MHQDKVSLSKHLDDRDELHEHKQRQLDKIQPVFSQIKHGVLTDAALVLRNAQKSR
jgi:hypothetical protein